MLNRLGVSGIFLTIIHIGYLIIIQKKIVTRFVRVLFIKKKNRSMTSSAQVFILIKRCYCSATLTTLRNTPFSHIFFDEGTNKLILFVSSNMIKLNETSIEDALSKIVVRVVPQCQYLIIKR